MIRKSVVPPNKTEDSHITVAIGIRKLGQSLMKIISAYRKCNSKEYSGHPILSITKFKERPYLLKVGIFAEKFDHIMIISSLVFSFEIGPEIGPHDPEAVCPRAVEVPI